MSGMPWFRLYHEMLEDEKIGTLSDSEFRTWIEILCLACLKGDGGNTGMTVSETSWKLRRNVSETLQKLLCIGVVTLQKNGNGGDVISVTNWKKRQFQSDVSTDRVKKHRENLRK